MEIFSYFTPARRKAIYKFTAGINALAVAVIPTLVGLGILEAGVASHLIEVSASLLALVSTVLAIKNVPASE